jgi:hypothetical protein
VKQLSNVMSNEAGVPTCLQLTLRLTFSGLGLAGRHPNRVLARLAGLDGNGVVGGSDLTRLLSRWN